MGRGTYTVFYLVLKSLNSQWSLSEEIFSSVFSFKALLCPLHWFWLTSHQFLLKFQQLNLDLNLDLGNPASSVSIQQEGLICYFWLYYSNSSGKQWQTYFSLSTG